MRTDNIVGAADTVPPLRAQVRPPLRTLGRVLERPRRFGPTTPPLALFSATILFGDGLVCARLLDGADGRAAVLAAVAGSTALLLGTAALCRSARSGRRSRRQQAFRLGLLAIGGVLAPLLVGRVCDQRLAAAGPEARRSAVRIASLLPAIEDGSAAVPGLDLARHTGDRPGDAALLLLLPPATVLDGTLSRPTDGALRTLLRAIVERASGGAETAFDDRFVPSVRTLRDAFNRYAERQRALAVAVAAIPLEAAAASRALPPDRGADAASVRAQVLAATEAADRAAAELSFADDVSALFGTPLPPGLSWAAFLDTDAVQGRWRTAIGAPQDVRLTPTMGLAAFRTLVYRPEMDLLVDARFGAALQPLPSFAPQGAEYGAGSAALRTAFMPLVVLGAALLEGTIALLVLVCCLLEMGPRPRSRLPAAAVAAAILLAPFAASNQVSRSEAFDQLDTALFEHEGAVVALLARWLIDAAPALHVIDDLPGAAG